jgi:hypothetical protein
MVSQKEAILKTLFHVSRKYEKAYCYPSQIKILSLVKKYHGINRSLRTLNRRLGEMEEEGFFTRTRRHRQGKDGRIVFNSTLYSLGARSFNWLFGMGDLAKRFFSFYHLPKLAQYKSKTARDLSSSGSLSAFRALLSSIGGPSGSSFFNQKKFGF